MCDNVIKNELFPTLNLRNRPGVIKNYGIAEIEIVELDKLTTNDSLDLNDSADSENKTPVSILQEILIRRRITPNYEEIDTTCSIKDPLFSYRVSFEDKGVLFSATGAGRSKKDAKHFAAEALIYKLTGVHLPMRKSNDGLTTVSCTESAAKTDAEDLAAQALVDKLYMLDISDRTTTGKAVNTEAKQSVHALVHKLHKLKLSKNQTTDTLANSIYSEKATIRGSLPQYETDNPIGKLQEMCQSHGWALPTYEEVKAVGMPHKRIFTIACCVRKCREIGEDTTKKSAKQLAAKKMWIRCCENPCDFFDP